MKVENLYLQFKKNIELSKTYVKYIVDIFLMKICWAWKINK